MATNYQRGRDVEKKAMAELQELGYQVIRAAGSKGPADLVAWNEDAVLFIQLKRTKKKVTGGMLGRLAREAEASFKVWPPPEAACLLWVWGDRLPGSATAQGWRKIDLMEEADNGT